MSWEFGIHWFGGRKAKGSQATRNGQPPGQGGRTAPEEVNVVQATQQIVQARPSSISPSELAAQLDDLKNVLSLAMPKIKLEKDCRYLPEKALSAIVKRERLEEVLPNATGDLIEFILEKAKKLFVITINSIPPNHVTAAMEEFKLHRLYDTHLPIEDIGQICGAVPKRGVSPLCGVGINSSCNHEPAIDAFHHYPWTSVNRDAFCDFQWRLLVPKFTMEKLEKFETNRILPILQRSPKSVGGGHFSQVFMAKLLTDYQDHFSVVLSPFPF
jgi:hypothetical protein